MNSRRQRGRGGKRPCRQFSRNGRCSYGFSCRFMHGTKSVPRGRLETAVFPTGPTQSQPTPRLKCFTSGCGRFTQEIYRYCDVCLAAKQNVAPTPPQSFVPNFHSQQYVTAARSSGGSTTSSSYQPSFVLTSPSYQSPSCEPQYTPTSPSYQPSCVPTYPSSSSYQSPSCEPKYRPTSPVYNPPLANDICEPTYVPTDAEYDPAHPKCVVPVPEYDPNDAQIIVPPAYGPE